MSNQGGNIDYWRKFFQSSNADIFEIMEQAITVAVSDCPREFKIRRDEIAEKLFTCRLPRCSGCDGLELSTLKEEGDGVVKDNSDGNGDGSEEVEGKESKGTCSTNVHTNLNDTKGSNLSYNEVEALTDMLEEETQTVEEVFRIKEILVNSVDQSSSMLLESLRRLELMDMSFQILMTTGIAKVVSDLRKDPRKEIASLTRRLVKTWKAFVSEWVESTNTAKGSNDSPDSVNPSGIEEEEYGLPSPPLDEGAFFAPEATSMELSKFFDGMDDDGNLDGRKIDDKSGRRFVSENRNVQKENNNIHKRKPQFPRDQNVVAKDNKNCVLEKQETVSKQSKLSINDSGLGNPSKVHLDQKANKEVKMQLKMDTTRTQRKLVSCQQKPKASGNLLDQKLEMAKRKLHQGYQQAENAKKQRTIQVMDLQDLPKQSFGSNSRSLQIRPGSHNRNWSNGRR